MWVIIKEAIINSLGTLLHSSKLWLAAALIFYVLIFQGCIAYAPAIYQGRMPPVVSNTKVEYDHSYLYTGIDFANAGTYYAKDRNYLLRSHVLAVAGNKHFNVNYGLYAYTGSYEITDFYAQGEGSGDHFEDKYSFNGWGPEFNVNFTFPLDRSRLGFGVYVATAFENGEYCDFLFESGNFLADEHRDGNWCCGTMMGLFFPYLMYHYDFSDSSYGAIQLGAGPPGTVSLDFSYHYYKFFWWASWLPAKEFEGPYTLGSFSIGAGYKLFPIN